MTAVKVALAVKVELGIVYQLLGGGGRIRLLFVSIKLFLILLVFGCYDILVLFYPFIFPGGRYVFGCRMSSFSFSLTCLIYSLSKSYLFSCCIYLLFYILKMFSTVLYLVYKINHSL